jgi:hypothetical protein
MNLASNLDSICRLAQNEPTPDVNAQIDRHKAAAVEILRAMAAAVGTTYPLPPNGRLREAVYWDLREADMPPTDGEIKHSLPIAT